MVCGVLCYVSYVMGGYIIYFVIFFFVDLVVVVVIYDVFSYGSGSIVWLVIKENILDIMIYCKIIKIYWDLFLWID